MKIKGFSVGDTVKVKGANPGIHTIASFDKRYGLDGNPFYIVHFTDGSATGLIEAGGASFELVTTTK